MLTTILLFWTSHARCRWVNDKKKRDYSFARSKSVERKKNFVEMKNFWMAFCVCYKQCDVLLLLCNLFHSHLWILNQILCKLCRKSIRNNIMPAFTLSDDIRFLLLLSFSLRDLAMKQKKNEESGKFSEGNATTHQSELSYTHISFDFQCEAYVHSMASKVDPSLFVSHFTSLLLQFMLIPSNP